MMRKSTLPNNVLPLKEAIKILSKLVPKRPSNPICECVLIIGDGSTLEVQAYDSDRAAKIRTENTTGFVGEIVVDFATWKKVANIADFYSRPAEFPPCDFPRYHVPESDFVEIGTEWMESARRCIEFVDKNSTNAAFRSVLLQREAVTATEGHVMLSVPGKFPESVPEYGADGGAFWIPEWICRHAPGGVQSISHAAIDAFAWRMIYPWGEIMFPDYPPPAIRWKLAVRQYSDDTPTITAERSTILAACAAAGRHNGSYVEIGKDGVFATAKQFQDPTRIGDISGITGDFLARIDPGFLKIVASDCPDGGISFTAPPSKERNLLIRVNQDAEEIRILMPLRIRK